MTEKKAIAAADQREDVDELEDRREADLLVRAGAEDVRRIVESRADEHRRRDRPDEGHEVEDAADEGGLPERGHRDAPLEWGGVVRARRGDHGDRGRGPGRGPWRAAPWRAAWSSPGHRISVVPSASWTRVMPSNQSDQRSPMCPWVRISYPLVPPRPRLDRSLRSFRRCPPGWRASFDGRRLGSKVVSGHHHTW